MSHPLEMSSHIPPLRSINADGLVTVPAEALMFALSRVALTYRALGMRPIAEIPGAFHLGLLEREQEIAVDLLRAMGALFDVGVPDAAEGTNWAPIMARIAPILAEVREQIRRGVRAASTPDAPSC